MIKKCPNCQSEIEDNEKYCLNCGTKIKTHPLKQYKYHIILIIIIILLAGVLCSMWLPKNVDSNIIDTSSIGKTVIKIHADDNVSGKITIYEFNNITQNSNGTYNLSEFGDYYGLFGFYSYHSGNSKDIPIKNGEAVYEIPAGTDFFYLYPYATDLNKEYSIDTNATKYHITVELYVNGVLKQSSISEMYSNQANINWGDKLINMNGDALTDSDLIPNTPHNKFVTQE